MISLKKSRAASTGRKPQVPTENNARTLPLPAPVRGLVEGAALSEQSGLWVANNVFPTSRGVRMRGGKQRVATVGGVVQSIFRYRSATTERLFAATGSDLYDITGMDPDNVPTATLTARASGLYSTAQLGTVAQEYMFAVNGGDKAQLFDGTAWVEIDGASTPSITGVDTATLAYVWTHKNRFWFIERESATAWYLPVDSAGGAAQDFSLAGVFQNGGSLIFGATWSQDSGSGMDDRIAFFSDAGEVAVYEGTNPANAADWAQVGVYQMPRPLGQDAHIRAGGDVLVATQVGLISLSAVVNKDPAALEASAISVDIEPSWKEAARTYAFARPWQVVKWPQEAMAMVVVPDSGQTTFVANINTRGWAKYLNWDVQCATLFGGGVFFGSKDGHIYAAERGGSDDGAPYVCQLAYTPQELGVGSATKLGSAVRATFAASSEFNPQLSMASNYAVSFPAAPTAAPDVPSTVVGWDTAIWDTALWDAGVTDAIGSPIYKTGWVSQGVEGYTLAPQMQATFASDARPNVELLNVEVMFEVGAAVG